MCSGEPGRNQVLRGVEPGAEIAWVVFTDMDVEFRRIFFNLLVDYGGTYAGATEVAPSASILYQSDDIVTWDTEEVVLVGTGPDHDNLG